MYKTPTVLYLSAAETAKLVRAALKEHFPAVKFSVRSRVYAGGASIDVRWTDGPITKAVETIARRFEGATFDGMIDLKSSHNSVAVIDGVRQTVHFGSDFVMCQREYSVEFLSKITAQVAKKYGFKAPTVTEGYRGAWVECSGKPVLANGWTATELAMQAASETSA